MKRMRQSAGLLRRISWLMFVLSDLSSQKLDGE